MKFQGDVQLTTLGAHEVIVHVFVMNRVLVVDWTGVTTGTTVVLVRTEEVNLPTGPVDSRN